MNKMVELENRVVSHQFRMEKKMKIFLNPI